MVKKRTRSEPTEAEISAFADQADDAHKITKTKVKEEKKVEIARTTISLPSDLLEKVEDMATANKRAKLEHRTVSAIVKDALEKYINS
ncbi:hypothetical protein A3735_27110 [Oleiphilus sp. HI0061]|uniref:ribbon-helix-helix protein, CopG family n=1 Tax=Oleiphilus sp. HI0061 TaxID=1822239 RepID=UPI0007CFD049|nr:ribbon-helix-helix protein, CopG family [Oleiphilus sp. HI0061]KZY62508.1 hypothetical protein A3735_27155 [Oleiphilus sp. HI0061]KZY62525.1 hypothetical protein A3735_27110 [Oleiphilus sp. HI0061]